ncbi:MAG: amino acid ABC transporter permease [Christensenellaceae bacterium]
MNLDFSIIPRYIPMLLQGAWTTLVLTAGAVGLGIVLGLIAALMKMCRFLPLRWLANVYIELVRGTPQLVQLFLLFYGLPQLIGVNIPEYFAAILALGINSGAYVAEIVRAGIQAVDYGQTEGAYSLGMKPGLTMRYIILPQAVKNILPALGNEFIALLKSSSIVSVIGMTDLMRKSDIIRSITYRSFEPLLTVALMYFIMTFTLSKLLNVYERRLKKNDSR